MYEKIQLTETETFRPRYDSLAKDIDRLNEHVSNLFHDDRLFREVEPSFALADTAAVTLEDNYFAQGLYAEIETQYTRISLDPDVKDRPDAFDRLIAAGQGQRVIRSCLNSLPEASVNFWYLVDERRRGFRFSSNWAASEKHQKAQHHRDIAQISRFKAKLLAQLDVAQELFERGGATQGQLARLAAMRADIENEKRQRVAGKPDPRRMDADLFWEIIGTPGSEGELEQIEAITDRLSRYKATAIKAFDELLQDIDRRAYRTDIWALAYLLNGGCSDDDFEVFRSWLILQGQSTFEAALENPDAFDVSLFSGHIGGCDTLRNVPLIAYEIRTGKVMKRKQAGPLILLGPHLEEEDFATALPLVAAAIEG